MRTKTSIYIEETIDDCISERASIKQTSRSNVVERDLENLLLCIQIGRHEIDRALTAEERKAVVAQLKKLSSEKTTTLFISVGSLEGWKGEAGLLRKVQQLSPLARLSLIDISEEL